MSPASLRLVDVLDATWQAYKPQVVFAGAVQIGRAAIAIVIASMGILALMEMRPALVDPAQAKILAGLALLVVLLLALSSVISAYTLFGPLRANRMPSPALLTAGAFFDHVWVVLGWMATGYTFVPFPALLVVVIGIHGVLLGAWRTAALTAVGACLFVAAHQAGNPLANPQFTSEAQLAILFGVAVLSAIVGNRLRAADWIVERLTSAIDRLRSGHQQLIDQLPVGLVLFGPDGNLVTANPGAAAAAGATGDQLLVWLEKEIPDAFRAVAEALCDSADGGAGESQVSGGRWFAWQVVPSSLPDLSWMPASAFVAPIAAGKGEVDTSPRTRPHALLALHDVTDRRRAEEARRRADHFEQVAELSAGLAHEIRNPLAALRSAAEQLQEATWSDPLDARLMGIVVREADRLNRLVTDFLDFARIGRGEVASSRVSKLIDDAVQVARTAASEREVTIAITADAGELVADGDLVFRVLSNLVLNAVSFAPAGSRVDVEAHSSDRVIRFTVRDRGIGVPPEDRARIFRPFVTGRPNGAGLGLAIASRSAALLGGSLSVSDPDDGGPGALFTFEMPRYAALPSDPVPAHEHD